MKLWFLKKSFEFVYSLIQLKMTDVVIVYCGFHFFFLVWSSSFSMIGRRFFYLNVWKILKIGVFVLLLFCSSVAFLLFLLFFTIGQCLLVCAEDAIWFVNVNKTEEFKLVKTQRQKNFISMLELVTNYLTGTRDSEWQ